MDEKPAYLIFLDFDGVLHSVDASHDSERFRPEAIALVNRIADYVDARIVLSTAWRMEGETQKYNGWFKNRVIGATPVNPLDMSQKNPRYHEVLRYLDENDYQDVPWVAVDVSVARPIGVDERDQPLATCSKTIGDPAPCGW